MEISTVIGQIQAQDTSLIILCLFEDEMPPFEGTLAELDSALNHEIESALSDGDFSGKRNETLVIRTFGLIPPKRVLLVGLGKQEAFTQDTLREAMATAATAARQLRVPNVHALVINGPAGKVMPEQAAEAMVEGALLGLYRFTELKTENKEEQKPDPERFVIVTPSAEGLAQIEAGLRAGRILAEATMVARDLVNRPANIATPDHIAETAREIASKTGLTCRVIDKATMETLGMELLLSVNQGSDNPAQLIVLEHHPEEKDLPTIVLVGKGITFDTGGISLKPSAGMERMKGDMGGAAAVLGTMRAVALLDLPLHVVGLAPVTENMPDAKATKPGDVVRSLKGLTVEIINTDAEGRLILADALTYAGEFEPDAIVDVATLTGGRIIALGDHAAAVMGDDDVIERLRSAGDRTHERVWPLPLFDDYGKHLESDVADLKNVGGRAASAITAGFFLSRFVPNETPWVHIDIAGLETAEKARPYVPKGGTGFGVRLLVDLLRNWVS
ncbi:MAG: leucyl aminopeptidase [Anaerolineae bacterium]